MEDPRIQYPLCIPRDSSNAESILESAQTIKLVQLFPSIAQEAFCPKIPLLYWHSVGAPHLVRKSWFQDNLEAWEARNTETLF